MTCSRTSSCETVGHFDPQSVMIASLLQPAVARAIELDEKHAGAGCDRAGVTDRRGASRRTRRCGASRGGRVAAGVVPAWAGDSIARGRSKRPRRSSAPRCARLRTSCQACSIWARATPPGATPARRSAPGRPRSSATIHCPRSTSSSPTRTCASAMAMRRPTSCRRPARAGPTTRASRSRRRSRARPTATSTEALAGLKPVLDGPAPGTQTLGLAVRLAAANMATADDQAGAEATLRALASKLQASGADMPPLATRWLAYLDKTVGSRDRKGRGFWGSLGRRVANDARVEPLVENLRRP